MLLRREFVVNFLGLAVLGLSGIIINIVVAKLYSAEGLGVFNQALAFFFIASQLAVGGVQFSALQKVSVSQRSNEEVSAVLCAALTAVIGVSLLIAAALAFLSEWLAAIFKSPDLAEGLRLVAISLVFYAINKVALSTLNGLQKMTQFGFVQLFRGTVLCVSCVLLALFGCRPSALPFCLIITEISVLIFVCFLLAQYRGKLATWLNAAAIKSHLVFGIQGFASGALIEINARADILVLGYFLSDGDVGLYSFAALVAEGAAQILYIVRNFINPELAGLLVTKDFTTIRNRIAHFRWKLYLGMLITSAAALAGLYVLTHFFYGPEFYSSVHLLAIILCGLCVAAGFIPFDWIFLQAGRPWQQSLYVSVNVLTNIILNVIFVQYFGLYGAAYATALAYCLSPLYLMWISTRILGTNVFLGARTSGPLLSLESGPEVRGP